MSYGRHPGETEREAMERKSADWAAMMAGHIARIDAFIGPRRLSKPESSYSYAPGWQGLV